MQKMTAIILALTVVSTSAFAQQATSPCKGKVETECKANAVCIWVNGYKTVAGTDRKGYCRMSTKKAQ